MPISIGSSGRECVVLAIEDPKQTTHPLALTKQHTARPQVVLEDSIYEKCLAFKARFTYFAYH